MKTVIMPINSAKDEPELLKEAGRILREGGLVAFPTETVYGLGANALDGTAAQRIYEAKGRPSDNPLIVHIADFDDIFPLVAEVTPMAQALMEAFWPGPMTLILRKSELVPERTTGGLATVALRMPADERARELIRCAQVPVAAPSANLSGRPSPTTARHVREDMEGRIDAIVDGGQVQIGLESTIIDCTGSTPIILRPGYISPEMVRAVIGTVELDKAVTGPLSKEEHPRAPGMKYRHYAPRAELVLVEGEAEAVVSHINRRIRQGQEQGKRIGVIATEENLAAYCGGEVLSIGSGLDEALVAHNLYALLRTFDERMVDVIYSEGFSEDAMGGAIMNRLKKAAGYRIENASAETF